MIIDGMNYESWEKLNQRLFKALSERNWGEIKLTYYDLAMFMQKEGRDTFRYIHESLKGEVAGIQGSTFDQVELISAADACVACKTKAGEVYPLSEILTRKVVPHADCTNQPCRCTFAPVVDLKTADECEECGECDECQS